MVPELIRSVGLVPETSKLLALRFGYDQNRLLVNPSGGLVRESFPKCHDHSVFRNFLNIFSAIVRNKAVYVRKKTSP